MGRGGGGGGGGGGGVCVCVCVWGGAVLWVMSATGLPSPREMIRVAWSKGQGRFSPRWGERPKNLGLLQLAA